MKPNPAALTAALAVVGVGGLTLVRDFEGLRTTPYYDIVGVRTVCYGHTGKFAQGKQAFTKAECDAILSEEIVAYARDLRKCLNRTPTQNQMAAMTSLTYNVGVPKVCKSTLVRKFNAGDIQGAADQFGAWKYAGGKVVRGLERRRAAEKALFLSK